MGETPLRRAPPTRSIAGTPAAWPARSISAISTAEWAPVLPMSALRIARVSFGRIHASAPISTGAR